MQFVDVHGNFVEKPDDAPLKTKVCVYGLLIVKNYILLTQDKDLSFKEPPGGTVDEGESDRDALVREVREEAGMNIALISDEPISEHVENFYDVDHDTYYESTRKVYLIERADDKFDLDAVFDHEIGSIGFYHLDTLEQIQFQDFMEKTIKAYISDKNS